jgi:RNA polymerase sigma factor (sigma-70 family)
MDQMTVQQFLTFQTTGCHAAFTGFWATALPFVSQVVARELTKRLVTGPAGRVDDVAVAEITQGVAARLLELPRKPNRAGWFDPARCGGSASGLKGWLDRIASNAVIDYCRTYRMRGRTDLKDSSAADLELNEVPIADPAAVDPQVKFAESELRQIVAECLGELSSEEQEFYRLRFVEGRSQAACAKKLGFAPATASRRQTTLEEKMRKKLAARGVDATWYGPAA